MRQPGLSDQHLQLQLAYFLYCCTFSGLRVLHNDLKVYARVAGSLNMAAASAIAVLSLSNLLGGVVKVSLQENYYSPDAGMLSGAVRDIYAALQGLSGFGSAIINLLVWIIFASFGVDAGKTASS